jgi:hypothetical protein
MPIARSILWFIALVFAAFGTAFSLLPRELAALTEIELATPTARVELASLYGGMELGIAAFLAYCALDRGRVRAGLIAAAWILAGTALVRGVGVLSAGPVRPVLYLLLALEASGVALALWSAARLATDPSP